MWVSFYLEVLPAPEFLLSWFVFPNKGPCQIGHGSCNGSLRLARQHLRYVTVSKWAERMAAIRKLIP